MKNARQPMAASGATDDLSEDMRQARDHATQRLLQRALAHRAEQAQREEAHRRRLDRIVWRSMWIACAALAALVILWIILRSRSA